MRTLLFIVVLLSLAVSCGKKTTIKDPPAGTSGGTGIDSGTADGTTAGSCQSNCIGKQCGPDNCGGFCGMCPQGQQCNADGMCTCNSKCEGKLCGPDGCGGFCGSCGTGQACNGAGQCVNPDNTGCLPNCAGKICGNDGCGSQCGKCPVGQICAVDGKECVVGGSTACGSVNEVGECQSNNTIAVTCKSGKLVAVVCSAEQGLTCAYSAANNQYECVKSGCSPSCANKECGPDGCGGVCGKCALTKSCNANGKCQSGSDCITDCNGKKCGPDGCGGQCGICGPGQKCGPIGQCVSESGSGCTPNCTGKACGSDGCGDTCGTCKSTEQCQSGQCVATNCTPDCNQKECGQDGCGGSCGNCLNNQVCDSEQHCVTPSDCGNGLTYEGKCSATGTTVEWCEGGATKTQDCTKYGDDFICAWLSGEKYYWCLNKCQAACLGKQCGSNGCGGVCGTCLSNQTCSPNGSCLTGGGGNCGEITFEGVCEGNSLKYCAAGELITQNCGVDGKVCLWSADNKWFQCGAPTEGCTPNCLTKNNSGVTVPKECGDDGCGNSCGDCVPGEVCSNGLCTTGQSECGSIDYIGTCEGNTLKYCASGALQTMDCTESNQVCGYEQTTEWFNCVEPGTGESCGDIDSKGTCQNALVKWCNTNNKLAFTNCAALGKSCVINSNGAAVCE